MFSRAALAAVSTTCREIKIAVGISKGCCRTHYVKRTYSNIRCFIAQCAGQSAAGSSEIFILLPTEQVHKIYLFSTIRREAVILGICKESISCFFKSICFSLNLIMVSACIGSLNLGTGILNLLHHAVDTIIFKAAVGRNIHLATGKSNVGSRR